MTASHGACQGTDNVGRVGSNIAFGEGVEFVGNNQNKHDGFLSFDPIASPRINKQKRLVRNGCISPNNIAKAKQLAGKDANSSTTVANNNHGSVASTPPHISVDIRELVAEDDDSHTGKGKGVISHPCSSQGSDIGNKNLHRRLLQLLDSFLMKLVLLIGTFIIHLYWSKATASLLLACQGVCLFVFMICNTDIVEKPNLTEPPLERGKRLIC
ncbi:UNVERIFIED_CONTAM: hypothetical protein Sangu_1883500 [Sesamum angustifolium]|uniref:Uncharacterized protein n=1 Tax=Sesamum angustifolium TaxID=2727405 RepID=A0AAW2LV22_9LAMI